MHLLYKSLNISPSSHRVYHSLDQDLKRPCCNVKLNLGCHGNKTSGISSLYVYFTWRHRTSTTAKNEPLLPWIFIEDNIFQYSWRIDILMGLLTVTVLCTFFIHTSTGTWGFWLLNKTIWLLLNSLMRLFQLWSG